MPSLFEPTRDPWPGSTPLFPPPPAYIHATTAFSHTEFALTLKTPAAPYCSGMRVTPLSSPCPCLQGPAPCAVRPFAGYIVNSTQLKNALLRPEHPARRAARIFCVCVKRKVKLKSHKKQPRQATPTPTPKPAPAPGNGQWQWGEVHGKGLGRSPSAVLASRKLARRYQLQFSHHHRALTPHHRHHQS